jgi:outer membrane protein TolC
MHTAARHQLEASQRSRLPEISLISRLEADTPSPVEEPEEWIAWAGMRLSVPVLSPNQNANTQETAQRLTQQKALLDDTINTALLAVRDSYTKRKYAETQWIAARERTQRMHEQLNSHERIFQSGMQSVLQVEQARIEWLMFKEHTHRSFATTLQHHIALVHAQGGP